MYYEMKDDENGYMDGLDIDTKDLVAFVQRCNTTHNHQLNFIIDWQCSSCYTKLKFNKTTKHTTIYE